jgi:uncharacterized protein (TIGR01777 family)
MTGHVVISGASGLVGTRLRQLCDAHGRPHLSLVRRAPTGAHESEWDPRRGLLESSALEGAAAVVHLAGESIASGRWSADRKRRLRESRILGTRLVAETLARLAPPLPAFVSASAIGYYGDSGDALVDETSDSGVGFLAELCRAWESATAPAGAAGIRVVHPRLGVVLASEGGMLAQLLLPFRMGVGGVVGSGRQVLSWIGLGDAAAALLHLVDTPQLSGPVNLVAPAPATNVEFTRALGRVLSRPTILPLPSFAVRALFGEMGRELLLAGQRVSPQKLLDSGFEFTQPELEPALRGILSQD